MSCVSSNPYAVIYRIRNLVNGKVYIGQTRQELHTRLSSHFTRTHNKHLKHSINKYGKEAFRCQIVCQVYHADQTYLDFAEQAFIAYYHSNDPRYGYNKTTGGFCNYKHIKRRSKRRVTIKPKPMQKRVSKAVVWKQLQEIPPSVLWEIRSSHPWKVTCKIIREEYAIQAGRDRLMPMINRILKEHNLTNDSKYAPYLLKIRKQAMALRWGNPSFRKKAIDNMRRYHTLKIAERRIGEILERRISGG